MIDAWWNEQAETIEGARNAVWSEPSGWEEHTAEDVRLIAGWFGDLPAGLVVEIGCGIGRLTYPMAKAMPSHLIYGVDTSERMIHWASSASPPPNLFFKVGGLGWLHIASAAIPQQISGIYSMLTFQHLDPRAVHSYLYDARQLLVDGGKMIFQFVTGHHHAGRDHRYQPHEMGLLAAAAGWETAPLVAQDSRHPEWSWMVLS